MQLTFTLFLTVLLAELGRGAVLQAADPLPLPPAPVLTFDQFVLRYDKRYSTLAELHYRRLIFLDNLRRLERHNANPNRTYTMSANCFLDVASAEFHQLYTTTRPSDPRSRSMAHDFLKARSARRPCRHPSDTAQRDQLPECPPPTHNISLEPSDETNPESPSPANHSERLLQPVSSSLERSILLKADPKLAELSNKSLLLASDGRVNLDWSLYAG